MAIHLSKSLSSPCPSRKYRHCRSIWRREYRYRPQIGQMPLTCLLPWIYSWRFWLPAVHGYGHDAVFDVNYYFLRVTHFFLPEQINREVFNNLPDTVSIAHIMGCTCDAACRKLCSGVISCQLRRDLMANNMRRSRRQIFKAFSVLFARTRTSFMPRAALYRHQFGFRHCSLCDLCRRADLSLVDAGCRLFLCVGWAFFYREKQTSHLYLSPMVAHW